MRIPRIKLTIAAALAVVGITAAVAVAAPAGLSPNQKALQSAFAETGKASSEHFSFSLSVAASGSNFAITGSGGVDTKHQSANVSVNLGALSQALGSATGGTQIPKTIQVVVLNKTAYVYLPSVAASIKPGAQWLKFDTSSLPSSVTKGANPGALTNINPQQALAQLTAAVTVHKLGKTTVRGSSTTHYQAAVNIAKVVAILPKSQQATEKAALAKLGLKSLPIDVYVDGSGLVRRVGLSLAGLKAAAGSPAVSLKMTFDLYDFGTHVSVSAPPASKTADGSTLLSSLTKGLGG